MALHGVVERDSVHEVLELAPEQIEDPPKIGSRWRAEFIKGIGKREEEFIIILDIDRIFSADELVTARDSGADSTVAEAAETAV